MIGEARDILATTILPEARAERAHELLEAAVRLADNLLTVPPAAIIGRKGGMVTAKRGGSEYFRKLAMKRKSHKGGRPPKSS